MKGGVIIAGHVEIMLRVLRRCPRSDRYGPPPLLTSGVQVNVLPCPSGDTAICMTEAVAGTYQMEVSSLATIAPLKYEDSVKGALTTAHPSVCPDGTLVNITSDVRDRRTRLSLMYRVLAFASAYNHNHHRTPSSRHMCHFWALLECACHTV